MDTKWFDQVITERFGSLRQFALAYRGPDRKPVDPTVVWRKMTGERRLQLEDIREIARLLDESPVEVAIRAGLFSAADVQFWLKASRV